MRLKRWDDLPEYMKCDEVKEYYDILSRKRFQLALKRGFDIILAFIMLIFLTLPMLVVAVLIKVDSRGPVFFRQERVTTYGKLFKIHKFRTMVNDAEKRGTQVTTKGDSRITKIGEKLRKYRIDELPQLFDVLSGTMSFVGTRPETTKYVKHYTKEMYATLLLPAGITSEASVKFKDEAEMLAGVADIDKAYIEQVLPAKMKWNLESVKKFSIGRDFGTMIKTVFAVFK